jgi:hypothetical protein
MSPSLPQKKKEGTAMGVLVGFQDTPYPRYGLPALSRETLIELNKTAAVLVQKYQDQADAVPEQVE